jgi:hypothetical protein
MGLFDKLFGKKQQQETLDQGFEHHYLVIEKPEGHIRAIQPFFVHSQKTLRTLPLNYTFAQ